MKPRGILGQAGPLMLGRAGATVLGFALPLILTRLLPQAEFGTYKQVWLVVTTGYFMLQLGLSQSLYYFVPRQPQDAGPCIGNAIVTLSAAGLGCVGLLLSRRRAQTVIIPELHEHRIRA